MSTTFGGVKELTSLPSHRESDFFQENNREKIFMKLRVEQMKRSKEMGSFLKEMKKRQEHRYIHQINFNQKVNRIFKDVKESHSTKPGRSLMTLGLKKRQEPI